MTILQIAIPFLQHAFQSLHTFWSAMQQIILTPLSAKWTSFILSKLYQINFQLIFHMDGCGLISVSPWRRIYTVPLGEATLTPTTPTHHLLPCVPSRNVAGRMTVSYLEDIIHLLVCCSLNVHVDLNILLIFKYFVWVFKFPVMDIYHRCCA